MSGYKVAAVVLAGCLLGPTSFAGSVASTEVRERPAPTILETFRGALAASGIGSDAERARLERAFLERVDDLKARLGGIRSPYRRARRLHDALHASVFSRYRATADGIAAILDRGEYNCVSATLFYGLTARALDLPAQIVASPKHVHLRLLLPGRDVDVECTSPEGFDVERNLAGFVRFVVAYKLATREELEGRGAEAIFEEFHQLAIPVSVEQGVSFIWHNAAQRALETGDADGVARALREEFRIAPEATRASESTSWCLSHAFRVEYEAGRFDSAYRIAALDVEIYPGKTTPKDRLLAAALKRIETACARGDAAGAETILNVTKAAVAQSEDGAQLDREACPRIAAVAVRDGAWELADRMVLRFLLVERDPIESARLAAWVEARRDNGIAALPGTIDALSRIGGSAGLTSSLLDSSSPFPLASPAGSPRGRHAGEAPRSFLSDEAEPSRDPSSR